MHTSPSDVPSKRDRFHGFPLTDADLCVKCALCLPHCPTYKLSRHEGDSPRGRIALMQGLAQGVLEPEGRTAQHLDGCLVCRACEPVCPAQVPYGRLIDAGRDGLWRAGHRPGWMWQALAFLRRTPQRLAWLTRLLRFSCASRLAHLATRLPLGRASRAATFVRKTGKPPSAGTHGSSTATPKERVSLFLGCIARALDADVLHATVRVLNAMGYAVDVPATQGCCGAMDAHAGDRVTATMLAKRNISAFSPADGPVISTASGCGIQLKDYTELGVDGAESFASRTTDVLHFIAANAQRLPALASENVSVVVHAPCTLKNGMRQNGDSTLRVLESITGLSVKALGHQDCCGAAGSYLFEHVESADRLGEKLLDALADDIPDILVTANVGCALHIEHLASERGIKMRVLHPVQLLAMSLPDSDSAQGRL